MVYFNSSFCLRAIHKAVLPDISVALKFNPQQTLCIHPKGTFCGVPAAKFLVCLDLEHPIKFIDGHYLAFLALFKNEKIRLKIMKNMTGCKQADRGVHGCGWCPLKRSGASNQS